MVRRVFQRRTSTGSEDLAKPLLRNVKSPLPVGVRPLETPLLKFSIINDKRQTTISYTWPIVYTYIRLLSITLSDDYVTAFTFSVSTAVCFFSDTETR